MGCAAVPKYDAFGREIGEDTLSGLGGGSSVERPTPEAEPAPEREPVVREAPPERVEPPEPQRMTFSVPEGAPVTVMPGRRRRSSGLGCLVGLVVAGAIVVGPVIGIVGLVGSADNVIDGVTDGLELPEELLPPPTGVGGDSMIARSNLAGALEQVRDEGYTRATGIDVRPGRVTFTVVEGGRERDVEIAPDASLVTGATSPANTAFGTLRLAAVDPAAPARLVRGAARRYPVKPSGIDYVLARPEAGGDHHWRAYFKRGIYVEGDAAGRVIRRFD
jgi:hypothetical protein